METLSYILSTIICFLGLTIGVVLAYNTKEELKPGKKYFKYLSNIILFLILIFVVSVSGFQIAIAVLLSLLTFIALNGLDNKIKYNLTGLALFVSTYSADFPLVASLVFLYSLIIGTMFASKIIKKNIIHTISEVIKAHYPFLILALIPFLLQQLL